MCARDPSLDHSSSQSIQKVINHVNELYQFSPTSICIRNDRREILYSNPSFHQLHQFFLIDAKSDDKGKYVSEVDIFLSQLELDCLSLGTGCVLCNSFEYKNIKFQVRMECREYSGEGAIVLWFMNLLISTAFVGGVRETRNDNNKKVNYVVSLLSDKNLSAFSFFILGFSNSEISSFLNINERAVRRRIEVSKSVILKEFNGYRYFRDECYRTGKINSFVKFVVNFLNVI